MTVSNTELVRREPESASPAPTSALDYHTLINRIEAAMFASPDCILDLPLTHRFTDGMYIREIFMPAGSTVTSRIHKTQHPYILLSGKLSVFMPEGGVEHLSAPHVGITEPGTRRVLYMHTDCRWITFHLNLDNETDPEKIVERVTDHAPLPTGIETREELVEQLQLRDNLQPQLDYGGAP